MKLFNYEIRKVTDNSGNDCSCGCGGSLFPTNYKHAAMNLSTVFRCVDIISDSLAILPIRVIKETNDCRNELKGHSLNTVFRHGISNQITAYQFMKLLIKSVLLKGNGYARILRASDGTVTELQYVESGDVQIHYDRQRRGSLYYTVNFVPKRIEPCNMIHLRKHSDDGVNGISVLHYALRTIDLASNGEDQANNVFSTGRNPSGVLTVNSQLTKEQRRDIHNTWKDSMSEFGDGLAVLQGNMSYQHLAISQKDQQLLESRLFQVQEIARWFGVNPVLIGDLSHSSYGSLEAAQQEFLLHTLSGYITMVQEEFTMKLFKPSERGLSINLDETAILRTDKQALANYYKTMLESGCLCVNEVRKELGYNEIEGGDKHIIAYTDINQNTINNDKGQTDNKQDL